MKHFATILGLLATAASAHMRMSNPPALMGLENPFGTAPEDIIRAPISAAQFPCQGYHQLFVSKDPKAKPVAKWETGSQQKFQVMGLAGAYQATHGGGSCQVSFSTDNGETFRVVKSFVGDCPALTNDDNNGHGTVVKDGFPFNVPKDLPTGPILFAWTWFNNIGNREMYMNCAVIDIVGEKGEDAVKFDDRPEIFKANIDNGCSTSAFTDINFPAPGPDVVVAKNAKLADPEGSCGPVIKGATPVEMTDQDILAAGSMVGTDISAGDGAASGDASNNSVPATDGIRKLDHKPESGETGFVGAPAASAYDAAPPTSAAPVAAAPTAAAPAAPADTPAPAGNTSSGTTGDTTVLTGKCDTAGTWNCIDGESFQQCASGVWSVQMSMAAGTACKPGMSAALEMVVPAKREVRFSSSHVRRHMGRHHF